MNLLMRIKGSARPPGEPKQIRAIVTLEQLAPYPHAHSDDPFRVRGHDLLALLVADIVIFVLSNVVATNNDGGGTASGILWVIFLLGVLALIVLSIIALVQSRRSRHTGT